MTDNASKRSSHSRHLIKKESASAISFFATTGWTYGNVGNGAGDGAVLCGWDGVDDGAGLVYIGGRVGMDVGIGDGVTRQQTLHNSMEPQYQKKAYPALSPSASIGDGGTADSDQ